ncbi:putative RNA-directed DNA polymerase from transposon BS [Nephila pilipes]|uniref:Putative RNA-directed DNA polymerase from transposon BS n=1 Tax=Nephila pilipes TaxID=299642 RepID=A0A8X6I979_NEPPI|nr:putative RNA-directed DNA polymerase from transposon BS [Nephila pilipes]
MAIDHFLTLDGLTKKDNYNAILRATAISLIEENYAEPPWTRIFADGSHINETEGAGVYSKLFSLYATVGNFMTNFDAEVYAIHLALKNLILRISSDSFSRVVILADSSAAIQAISNNHHSENIQILFQWIPSHMGIDGNEETDLLAKRGNQEISGQNLIRPDSLKKYVHKNIENSYSDNLNVICKEKKMATHSKHLKNLQLKTKKRSRCPFQINDRTRFPRRISK